MRRAMNQEVLQESANAIKNALHELPQERKEGYGIKIQTRIIWNYLAEEDVATAICSIY